MPMAENEPSAAHQRWLAEYELAMLDEDLVARNVAIGAIQESPGGAVAGFITAATCHLNLLVAVAGIEGARQTLKMAALDVSLNEGGDDDRA